ncbi:MarR family winged helix-turn-helix transcriptional regulator [Defluviitalea phaphyphila]|uniref:MarR family winged helix-turn-helix transcriptional regulator n=1 Tax=Defluviitalea phaphyphila TaxID=1473580 RepID=UPI000730A5A8|nr:MarR family transcriptional regulator [Defluviitalea phaphyphila]
MDFNLNKCVNFISTNTIKKISEAFDRWLSEYNLTRIQWIALYFLFTKGDLSQRELSQLMEISDSSVLRLVDRLEREGLVKRERCQEDRRIIQLVLTEKGKSLIKSSLHVGSEFSDLLIKNIDEKELYIFQKVLQNMYENIMNDERSRK